MKVSNHTPPTNPVSIFGIFSIILPSPTNLPHHVQRHHTHTRTTPRDNNTPHDTPHDTSNDTPHDIDIMNLTAMEQVKELCARIPANRYENMAWRITTAVDGIRSVFRLPQGHELPHRWFAEFALLVIASIHSRESEVDGTPSPARRALVLLMQTGEGFAAHLDARVEYEIKSAKEDHDSVAEEFYRTQFRDKFCRYVQENIDFNAMDFPRHLSDACLLGEFGPYPRFTEEELLRFVTEDVLGLASPEV